MNDPQVTNATFVIERVLNATRERVFAAYSTLEAKARWFKAPADCETIERVFDFRPGGAERWHARWPGGRITDFQAQYRDIIETSGSCWSTTCGARARSCRSR